MPVNMPKIAVLVATKDSHRITWASELAQHLSLAMIHSIDDSDAELFLAVTDTRVELRDRTPRAKGVAVDLGQFDARTIAGHGSKSQPIVRAFGANVRTIVDATAGLGQDAALLAFMGFHVTAVERSPILAALLEDGLNRAMNDARLANSLRGRLTIEHSDARELLPRMNPPTDAVYLDPMFPPKRKKSALAPRSIRLVRAVVGEDEDAVALLAVAMRTAIERVVVKRPSHAPPLMESPTASYEGKLARFDVYHTRQSSNATSLNRGSSPDQNAPHG